MIPIGHAAIVSLSLLSLTGAGSVQSSVRPAGPSQAVEVSPGGASNALPWLRLELPAQAITLPSGEVVDFGAHEIWRPVCYGENARVSQEDLAQMVLGHQASIQHQDPPIGEPEPNGFNIVFVPSGNIPAGATAALAASEAYIESFFSDPITITINVSFQPLGPGVLGGTSSASGYVSYGPARAQIVGDMDASDTLQSSLPSGSTCPVRYTSGSSVTNENRVFFTFADWKAVDGTVSGVDANMTFSTNFAFDYDPSNGISAGSYSFTDVVIHETGHAMGFTSGVDFRFRDMETLDLFRFQRTDGSGDYNPDTTTEFGVRPRLCAFNAPNDDHNSDLISAEYRMADGSPYQASHFREQTPNIGLMDPAIAAGQTFYPAYYSTADLAMFDAIGYDY